MKDCILGIVSVDNCHKNITEKMKVKVYEL